MYLFRFIFEMICGSVIFSLLAAAWYCASADNIEKLEKLTRNRVIGLIIALPALAACVPHAQIIAPGILQDPVVLWFLAVAIPVLSYFYIDFYAARAVSGAVIILAYDLIHYAYDGKITGAVLVTVSAWIFGFAGIWSSGKPCSMRDSFRLAARNRIFANCMAAASVICALVFLWTLVAGLGKLK